MLSSITRRAFVHAASAVTAAVGTGAAVTVAAPAAEPSLEGALSAAVQDFRAKYQRYRAFVDDAYRPIVKMGHPVDMNPEWVDYCDAREDMEDARMRMTRAALTGLI